MQDGPGRDRRIVPAGQASPEQASWQLQRLAMLTPRAAVAVGPARRCQVDPAGPPRSRSAVGTASASWESRAEAPGHTTYRHGGVNRISTTLIFAPLDISVRSPREVAPRGGSAHDSGMHFSNIAK